jgi:pimeloyl-ACP methyl ester carboxylesterase
VLASTAARLDLHATGAMMERLGGPHAREVADQFWNHPSPEVMAALDPITPVACSRAILEALRPGVGELVVFETAGHGVHRDAPEAAEALLRRFYAG